MANHVTDAILLERFVSRREESAFEALVLRHGPRVRSTCRRVLRSEHDAEDVAQATFLVLALKAAEVSWRDSVGGWLCAVAHRLSLHARAGASRRSRFETPVAALVGAGSLPEPFHPLADPLAEIAQRDLRRVLDDELSLLPEKYRAPVVLCDVEGLSHAEAAVRLGMPAGSTSRRLTRARAILRRRLTGRGLPLAIVLLCGVLVSLWGWQRDPGAPSGRLAVKQAMAPFKEYGDGRADLGPFLSRLDRDDALALARQSARLASRIEGVDPGHDRPAWRSITKELNASSLDLARAARASDPPALLAAVRRMNASCVECHLAYRG
jgi:RNA polymerase sigma factor (sigma-70 family)